MRPNFGKSKRAARPYRIRDLRKSYDTLVTFVEKHPTLIVTELSRLGRSTAEVISLVNALVSREVRVIILKNNLDISQHDIVL